MSKVVNLEDLSTYVTPGSTVGLGGAWMANHPMAAVRQLIRDDVRDLHVMGSLSSIDVDLMIGAGIVRELTFSMVSLEAYGLAPHFRKAVQDGTLAINEITGVAYNLALDAGARHIPYMPMVGLGGSQIPEVSPDHYAEITCPFTGQELLAVRALVPDVAIVHVLRADDQGNAQVEGPLSADPELARAAKRLIITCEELVDTETIAAAPASTHIPGFLVEAVIEAPFGAHPTTHVPRYGFDAWAVSEYADVCAAGDAPAYIAQLAGETEAGYRERVLDADRRAVLAAVAANAPTLEAV
ncbi:MAG: CoA transferase subunit A [Solirubrobacteraceae bacterium]